MARPLVVVVVVVVVAVAVPVARAVCLAGTVVLHRSYTRNLTQTRRRLHKGP